MKKILSIIAITITLAGCGSPAPTATSPTPPPVTGGPTVAYVTYTNIQPASGATYDVVLDALTPIHRLAPGQAWLYNITPGTHTSDWYTTTGQLVKSVTVTYTAGVSYTEVSP